MEWISVNDKLPENIEPVNIVWVNTNPEPYYADIKGKPFVATGHYCASRGDGRNYFRTEYVGGMFWEGV